MSLKQVIKTVLPWKQISQSKVYRRLSNIKERRRYIADLINDCHLKNYEFPNGSREDYIAAARKHLVSYEEYMNQFEFWQKSEEERSEFMSQIALRLYYNCIIPPHVEPLFWNKGQFIKLFSSFIHRKWLIAREATIEEFAAFIAQNDCIAKPQESACGNGVFKILSNDKNNISELYNTCLQGDYLLEECIANEPTLRAYHPESLNTVRIVTIKHNNTIQVLGAFVRFGTGGRCVDNGGNDGILALIDIVSGTVISDAMDKNGKFFQTHPNSGLTFKGLKIPRWHELVETCKQAANVIGETPVIGWDIVVTDNGIIDIIEGNHRPDAYGPQAPLKQGFKSRLKRMVKGEIINDQLTND